MSRSTKPLAAYLQGTGIGIAVGLGIPADTPAVYLAGSLAAGLLLAGYYFDKTAAMAD